MASTLMSDTTTRGIRVEAAAFFLPEKSEPAESKYVFGYNIEITNDGDRPVTLLSRQWMIIDGDGKREEVRGKGVVGQSPTIEPGRSFKYSSFCPLSTEWGSMEGKYQMKPADGAAFDVEIGRFFLAVRVPQREPAGVE